jgi:hypothetical protein
LESNELCALSACEQHDTERESKKANNECEPTVLVDIQMIITLNHRINKEVGYSAANNLDSPVDIYEAAVNLHEITTDAQ